MISLDGSSIFLSVAISFFASVTFLISGSEVLTLGSTTFFPAFISLTGPATLGGVIAVGGDIGWFLGGGAGTDFFVPF